MFFDEELLRLKREKLLEEAQRSRMIAQTRQRSTRRRYVYAPVFAWLGIHLCRWGTRLQERSGVAETAPTSQSMNNGIKA